MYIGRDCIIAGVTDICRGAAKYILLLIYIFGYTCVYFRYVEIYLRRYVLVGIYYIVDILENLFWQALWICRGRPNIYCSWSLYLDMQYIETSFHWKLRSLDPPKQKITLPSGPTCAANISYQGFHVCNKHCAMSMFNVQCVMCNLQCAMYPLSPKKPITRCFQRWPLSGTACSCLPWNSALLEKNYIFREEEKIHVYTVQKFLLYFCPF